jgi:hypothetical protein
MLNKLDSHSSLPTIQEIATNFRLAGWINFGVQLGLLVVSGLIVLFAIADPNFNLKAQDAMSGNASISQSSQSCFNLFQKL